jgi:hypothetical protein
MLSVSLLNTQFVDLDAHIGTANNAGAILVLGRDLVVVPKLIHPLPPAITSPEASPDHIEDTWMQVTLVLIAMCPPLRCFSLPLNTVTCAMKFRS